MVTYVHIQNDAYTYIHTYIYTHVIYAHTHWLRYTIIEMRCKGARTSYALIVDKVLLKDRRLNWEVGNLNSNSGNEGLWANLISLLECFFICKMKVSV